ncbi:hypothetical protein V2W45_1395194 [Cenococcum geophilum]
MPPATPPAATPTPALVLALAAPPAPAAPRRRQAWDSITVEQLQELIDSMQQRCQDVVNAQGGYTKW